MTIKSSRLLRPCNVAEMLACSERHVRNLISSGKLVAYKIGKRNRRVTRESVIKYLEENNK